MIAEMQCLALDYSEYAGSLELKKRGILNPISRFYHQERSAAEESIDAQHTTSQTQVRRRGVPLRKD